MRRIGLLRRSRSAILLLLAVCLASYSILGAFHQHGALFGSRRGQTLDVERRHGSASGPCLACRVSEQKVSVPVAAAGARLPHVVPDGLPRVRVKLPRSQALPTRSPRSPPTEASAEV